MRNVALLCALLGLALGAVAVDAPAVRTSRGAAERVVRATLADPRVRTVTDGWITMPRQGATPDVPLETPSQAVRAFVTGPSGVCALDAAYDASGRTLAAERLRSREVAVE